MINLRVSCTAHRKDSLDQQSRDGHQVKAAMPTQWVRLER